MEIIENDIVLYLPLILLYILNKKIKEISENHGTKEHQNKQLFNVYLFV